MTRCLKILHIEDDEHSAELLKCLVVAKIPGAIVKVTDDRSEAEKLKQEKWDLIVCDGDIPTWRNHFDDVNEWFSAPIVMLSARPHSDLEEFLQKGALKAFQKIPQEFNDLIEYIKNFLDQDTTSA